jgi:hypothetical protein
LLKRRQELAALCSQQSTVFQAICFTRATASPCRQQTGVQEGWFPKMKNDGWTGLAIINIGDEQAAVMLGAYGENGIKVAEESLTVEPGEEIIGLMDQVFSGDIGHARYFLFSSDQ